MAIERCKQCMGSKRVLGMGMLEKKCTACIGLGFKEGTDSKPTITEEIVHKKPEAKPKGKPKRGRPSKRQPAEVNA